MHDHGRYILNDQGEPELCDDLLKWARWFQTADRKVCRDLDEGDGDKRILVSTVFLGLDHSFGSGRPILWETMVFGGKLDGEASRYTSKDAAVRGHQDMCRRVMSEECRT